MINYDAIRNSILIKKPFKYSCIHHLLNETDAHLLREKLPQSNFYRSVREMGSDKTYNVLNNILYNLDHNTPEMNTSLPTPWQQLVHDLTSENYRIFMESLLNEDLSNCFQEITLKVYTQGDFLSYHTDKSDVKATHMIFFNETWEENWGGQLEFSEENNAEAFVKFNPLSMHSVAFVRADNSWHAVSMINEKNARRIALQVAFWNINKRHVLPGRIETRINEYD
jgi:SM-20-related protein